MVYFCEREQLLNSSCEQRAASTLENMDCEHVNVCIIKNKPINEVLVMELHAFSL